MTNLKNIAKRIQAEIALWTIPWAEPLNPTVVKWITNISWLSTIANDISLLRVKSGKELFGEKFEYLSNGDELLQVIKDLWSLDYEEAKGFLRFWTEKRMATNEEITSYVASMEKDQQATTKDQQAFKNLDLLKEKFNRFEQRRQQLTDSLVKATNLEANTNYPEWQEKAKQQLKRIHPNLEQEIWETEKKW